jgi:hypothetical protein
MKIINNFLDKETFNILHTLLIKNKQFPWYFEETINNKHNKEDLNFYFSHNIFEETSGSNHYDFFKKIFLKKIKVRQFIRIKVNFYPKTEKLVIHNNHIDYPFPHKGAILYVNSNDGYTGLENGKKVMSVENTLLLFNPYKNHHSTTCTNAKGRITIIFNYF